MPATTPYQESEVFSPRNQSAMDAGLGIRFFNKPVHNTHKSKLEGRAIFDDREFVEIRVPGDKDNVVVTPVTDSHRHRFQARYTAFKASQDQDAASGTVLSAWGGIAPHRVEEYAYGKLRTVEQLAALSDANIKTFGPAARQERQRAIDFIAAMKGSAPVAQLRAEVEKRDSEIEALKRTVKEMGEAVAKLTKKGKTE